MINKKFLCRKVISQFFPLFLTLFMGVQLAHAGEGNSCLFEEPSNEVSDSNRVDDPQDLTAGKDSISPLDDPPDIKVDSKPGTRR